MRKKTKTMAYAIILAGLCIFNMTGCKKTEVPAETTKAIYVEEAIYETSVTTVEQTEPDETEENPLPLCGDIINNPLQGKLTNVTAMVLTTQPDTVYISANIIEDKQGLLKKSRKDGCRTAVNGISYSGDLIDFVQSTDEDSDDKSVYYDIYGDYLENMEFIFEKEKTEPSIEETTDISEDGIAENDGATESEGTAEVIADENMIVYGVFYEDIALASKTLDCDNTIIHYEKGIYINGYKDYFIMGIKPVSESKAEQVGFQSITFKGRQAMSDIPIEEGVEQEAAMVSLQFTDYGLCLSTNNDFYKFTDVTVTYLPLGETEEITVTFDTANCLYFDKNNSTVGTEILNLETVATEGETTE